MKEGIHPQYNEITVVLTDGTEFKTRSTFKGTRLVLDIDRFKHPAWGGNASMINTKAGKMAKFSGKFGSLGAIDETAETK
jgi:large subunit ribosomal protein L31